MLTGKRFKTLEGARKWVAFEHATQPGEVARGDRARAHRYEIVRCRDGVPDSEPFDAARKYDWRIERLPARRR